MNYQMNYYKYTRRKSTEVTLGTLKLGGVNPIRVESMTNTNTRDVTASVKQCVELHHAGCEIIRLTAPSIRDVEALGEIRSALTKQGVMEPLVADIHFTPNAALKAVEFVENVRINPGNYADKKKFESLTFTDLEYEQELDRIHRVFKPLIIKAKAYGCSLRIGVNHGSLSDRIMTRYGDTPLGMVESALEFVRFCELYQFYEIVLSMKSSIPQVMIQAYRLLVGKLDDEGMKPYPLHLGVTEAGSGEEARVKSCIGIGSLLEDGLGDTIRVSLTENPVNEISVCQELVKKYNERLRIFGERCFEPVHYQQKKGSLDVVELEPPFNKFEYARRGSRPLHIGSFSVGGVNTVRVETTLCQIPKIITDPKMLREFQNEVHFSVKSFLDESEGAKTEYCNVRIETSDELKRLAKLDLSGMRNFCLTFSDPLFLNELTEGALEPTKIRICLKENVPFDREMLKNRWFHRKEVVKEFCFEKINSSDMDIVKGMVAFSKLLSREAIEAVAFSINAKRDIVFSYRRLWKEFEQEGIVHPIIIYFKTHPEWSELETLVSASVQVGSLLSDGLGDVVLLETNLPRGNELNLVYNILQGTRRRITKTEFISCPSCGRTLFDLEKVTEAIKMRTSHLKELRIAVMGCIVNGPGEMADADFGYVGTGVDEISLYVGKTCVERAIPQSEALEKLVSLIKSHGKWRDSVENVFGEIKRKYYEWRLVSTVLLWSLGVIALLLIVIEGIKLGEIVERKGFPTVLGRVMSAQIEVRGRSSYVPVVEYVYVVNQKSIIKKAELYSPPFGTKETRRRSSEKIIKKYVVGKDVLVSYNPDDENESFIDLSIAWDLFIRLGSGMLLGLGVIFFVFDKVYLTYELKKQKNVEVLR
ncbi:hypothetical protein CHS0354_000486 [Potamilus streckersoni]|uniref:4-hydroxy-3-methylbut-2-en-1-yl diphosphate synthase (ferredoxin), chloroplastic n=1 Tax=Potamilus streckersoni TaxID=2493646 RepID=A0AAE0T6T6_9BIVA|nr:hypothetical protein CHS0354_000486 [Potamilus streckersoni]